MAEKTVISIEVDGVQKSINSVKELKDSISDLQKIAESADLGSDRQKQAVKQVDELNSQLKKLTQTEEQYAKSLEDVAKAEKEAIKETNDLRKQFEVLEDQLFLMAGQGKQNTKEFRALTIEAAALNKKIDAVNSSLGENSAGRASAGFSQLSDGLRNLDFDSVKKGLAVMKTALAATGVMLLVQGVMYLVENFDSLSKGSGVLAKILRGVGDAISYVKNFVTDLVGATDDSTRALEKQGEAIKKSSDTATEKLQEQVSAFDRQIAVAKASGKNTVALEKAKQEAIIQTNLILAKQIEAYVRAGGVLDEEKRKQLAGNLAAIRAAKTEEKVIEITDYKERLEKKKELDAEFRQTQKELNAQNAKIIIEDQKLLQDQLKVSKINDAEIIGQELMGVDEKYNQINHENLKAWNDKNLAEKRKQIDQELELTATSFNAAKSLSDTFFAIKMANVKKGSVEEEKQARKQFLINKAFSISSTIISGTQGAIKALAANPPPSPLGVAGAIAVGLGTAAAVAQISATQFNNTGYASQDLGTTAGSGATPLASSAAPNIAPSTSLNPTTTTTFTGNNNNNYQPPVKAFVTESDIRHSSQRIDTAISQSTF